MTGAAVSERDAKRSVQKVQTDFLSSVCGYNLTRAVQRMTADFHLSVDDTGMRPVLVSILCVVEENPGIKQGAVGEVLGIARTNIAPLMNELEELKLLRRARHKSDGRALSIRLTDEGARVLDACKTRIRAHENRMLRRLTRAERSALLALLEKIR